LNNWTSITIQRATYVALLFLAINCCAQDKSVSVETVQAMKSAIVPVVCGQFDDKRDFKIAQVVGTGFFVDAQGRFLTTAHVIASLAQVAKTKNGCVPAIYVPDPGWKEYRDTVSFQYFWFPGCELDAALDLAVCQPMENPFASKRLPRENVSVVTFESAQVPDGTPVAFTGFPLGQPSPVTSKADIAAKYGADVYLIDQMAWGGDSGSPVYTDDGKVVGVITVTGQNEAPGPAKTAAAIVDFLSRHPARASQPLESQHGLGAAGISPTKAGSRE
jgi:S1-C subfamily serine protease